MRRLRVPFLVPLLFAALTAATSCAPLGLPGVTNCTSDVPSPLADEQQSLPWAGRILLIGDFGTDHGGRNRAVAAAVRQYLEQSPPLPTEVLLLGDNFYPRGLVGFDGKCAKDKDSEAAVAEQLRAVLGPYEFLREKGIRIRAIAGNHDHGCGAVGLAHEHDIDRFLPPPQRWGDLWQFFTGLPQEISLGSLVQIVVLDSHAIISDAALADASRRRLRELLASGKGRYQWQLLAAHHPLRSAGPHDGAWPEGLRRPTSFLLFPAHFLAALDLAPFGDLNQDLYTFRYRRYRRLVEGAVQQSGASVALVLSGHDHNLQLLSGRTPAEPLQVVAGSGAYCSPLQRRQDLLFGAAANGFGVLRYHAGALQIEFFTLQPCPGARPCAKVEQPSPHRAFVFTLQQRSSAASADAEAGASKPGEPKEVRRCNRFSIPTCVSSSTSG